MMASATIEAVTMVSHTMLTVALLLYVCDYLSDGKALLDAVFEKALRIAVELNVWIQCPVVNELSLRNDTSLSMRRVDSFAGEICEFSEDIGGEPTCIFYYVHKQKMKSFKISDE